jgi:hypothetical protein
LVRPAGRANLLGLQLRLLGVYSAGGSAGLQLLLQSGHVQISVQ